jgi:hypothetical protein
VKLLYSHYHYSGGFKRPKGPVVFSLSHIEKVFHAKILCVITLIFFTFPLVPILSSRRREIVQVFPNSNSRAIRFDDIKLDDYYRKLPSVLKRRLKDTNSIFSTY